MTEIIDVTAREILGLLYFGYSVKQKPGSVTLICSDPARAQSATIESYDTFMKGKEKAGANSIRPLLAMDPNLKSEIQGF